MILKAGTYRFNDVLGYEGLIADAYEFNFIGTFIEPNISFTKVTVLHNPVGLDYLDINFYQSTGEIIENPRFIDTDGEAIWNDEALGEPREAPSLTIPEQEVDDIWGAYFIKYSNYNEVNAKPLAEITYNGETIAQLNAGETCTLKCAGLPMETDIIVKVNG